MAKSPFLVVKDLISPLQCEDVIERLNHTMPNIDQRGHPTVTYKGNRLSEMRVDAVFAGIIPTIEDYYKFTAKTLTPTVFEWYPEGFQGQKGGCDGYTYTNKRGQGAKWRKINDYDFTVIIFLNDFNQDTYFDERFEVRGGKLQFLSHEFSFNPERGTAIVFPCRPNFAHAVGPIELGDLNMIRFHIVANEEYEYNMDDFPGSYREWFGNNNVE